MIGFSLVSFSQNSGIGCFSTDKSQNLFSWTESNIKSYLNKAVESKEIIAVTDAHQIYRSLSFLDPSYLTSLNLFDCKSFFHIYRNALHVDLYSLASKQYSISIDSEFKRIKKIWYLQNDEKWENIPLSLIEIFLIKDSTAALRIGEVLKRVTLPLETSIYSDFFRDFLVYLARLENNGVIEKSSFKKVIPLYHYDHIVTGRLINSTPMCFQTISKEKFGELYTSRFGKDGRILVADWKNADFRVAAAISQERVEGERKDPYTTLAKKSLNKTDISPEEREVFKDEIMSIMYGYDQKYSELFFDSYPNIKAYRKFITNEAREKRKLTTKFGKTRFFDKTEDKLETKAFNTICQMTVADLCKKAVIETQKEFTERNLKSVMIPYVVYDQLAADVHTSEIDQVKEALQVSMIDRTVPYSFRQFVDFEIDIQTL